MLDADAKRYSWVPDRKHPSSPTNLNVGRRYLPASRFSTGPSHKLKKYRPTGHRQKQHFSHREFSASVRVTWLVASENFGFRAGRCDISLAARSQGLVTLEGE